MLHSCKYFYDSTSEHNSTNTDLIRFWKYSSFLAPEIPVQTPLSNIMNAVQILKIYKSSYSLSLLQNRCKIRLEHTVKCTGLHIQNTEYCSLFQKRKQVPVSPLISRLNCLHIKNSFTCYKCFLRHIN